MNSEFPPFASSTLETSEGKKAIRVLIVDDCEDIRTMSKLILQLKGIRVLEAVNGQEAIEIACRERPDLILIDINMPVMSGLEATRQLKQIDLTKFIPVLAISANCSDPNCHQEALDAGCIDCLTKPTEWEKIQAVLDRF